MAGNASSMKSLVAYEKIRDMILVGEKLPGSRLILSDLERELGIGRGPIREALMRLDRSGLVKNIPYKGAVVASPPTRDEIYILFDVRMELEAQLVVKAMKKMDAGIVAELEQLQEQMAQLDKNLYSLDRKFHQTIYQAADMPHISSIVDKIIESLDTFLTLYRHQLPDLQKFAIEHGQIIEAIKSGDTELAQAAIRSNIRSGLEVVERTLSRLINQ